MTVISLYTYHQNDIPKKNGKCNSKFFLKYDKHLPQIDFAGGPQDDGTQNGATKINWKQKCHAHQCFPNVLDPLVLPIAVWDVTK